MATATKTTAQAGLSRKAYNDALDANRKASEIATYEKYVADTTEKRDNYVALVRDLRELHVKHLGNPGSEFVSSTVQSLDYEINTAANSVKRYQQKLDALKGETAPVNDDEF